MVSAFPTKEEISLREYSAMPRSPNYGGLAMTEWLLNGKKALE
jgi:hypothetical protein